LDPATDHGRLLRRQVLVRIAERAGRFGQFETSDREQERRVNDPNETMPTPIVTYSPIVRGWCHRSLSRGYPRRAIVDSSRAQTPKHDPANGTREFSFAAPALGRRQPPHLPVVGDFRSIRHLNSRNTPPEDGGRESGAGLPRIPLYVSRSGGAGSGRPQRTGRHHLLARATEQTERGTRHDRTDAPG